MDLLDLLVMLDNRVLKVLLEQMEIKGHQGQQDLWVNLDQLDLRATLDPQEQQVLLDFLGQLDSPVLVELKGL